MKNLPATQFNFFILIALTTVLLLAACKTNSSSNEEFPTGTYAPPVQRTAGITMVFSDDGSFVMSGPQFTPINGTYTVDKDQIVFIQTDEGLCAGIPGTYTWKSDGESLTFVAVDDQCSIRRIDWQAGPWKKQP